MLMWDLFFSGPAKKACDKLPYPLNCWCKKLKDKAAGKMCRDQATWDPGLVVEGYEEYCKDEDGDECNKCCERFVAEFCGTVPDDVSDRTLQLCGAWCVSK